MRLVDAPGGTALEEPLADEPLLEVSAAFGPGRRYWTMLGTAIVTAERLLLVMPADGDGPRRLVVEAPTSEVTVLAKPRWSFGTGLFLGVGDDRYTVEPEPLYGHAATPGRIRRARQAAGELERALQRPGS